MQRIIACGGILGDDNAVTLGVSIKRSRAHTRVQVHASDDQRVRIELMQNQIELPCRKGTEKCFMDDRFFLVRTKHIGTSVARRILKAHPDAISFLMRHAVITGSVAAATILAGCGSKSPARRKSFWKSTSNRTGFIFTDPGALDFPRHQLSE